MIFITETARMFPFKFLDSDGKSIRKSRTQGQTYLIIDRFIGNKPLQRLATDDGVAKHHQHTSSVKDPLNQTKPSFFNHS